MSQIPGKPIPMNLIDPTKIYRLFYRHGSNPNCEKLFIHDGTLHEAHEIGMAHCNLMNFHFIFVKPFLSNLKEDERKKMRPFGSGPLVEDSQSGKRDDSRSS